MLRIYVSCEYISCVARMNKNVLSLVWEFPPGLLRIGGSSHRAGAAPFRGGYYDYPFDGGDIRADELLR